MSDDEVEGIMSGEGMEEGGRRSQLYRTFLTLMEVSAVQWWQDTDSGGGCLWLAAQPTLWLAWLLAARILRVAAGGCRLETGSSRLCRLPPAARRRSWHPHACDQGRLQPRMAAPALQRLGIPSPHSHRLPALCLSLADVRRPWL